MEPMKPWFKLRGILMVPLILFCTFCTYGELKDKSALLFLGGAFFLAGLFLRIWAQMHLHYRLNVRKILTLDGPYTYVRNPIYIGNTLILLACAGISGLYWMIPVVLAYCIVVYRLVVRYEESHLTRKYGTAYTDYMQKVPRWLPQFKNTGNSGTTGIWHYFLPSVITELQSFLLLVPFVFKELMVR